MTMAISNETFFNKKRRRIIFTLLGFLLLYVVSYILDPFSDYWTNYFTRKPSLLFSEWGVSLLLCFSFSEISIIINDRLNRRLSWTERPTLRLATETLLNLVTVLLINLFIDVLFFYVLGAQECSVFSASMTVEESRGTIQWLVVSAIIAFMMMGINIGNYLLVNWKSEVLRSAELNQVATESELQALKLQIDPHFVFNNLSVLSELILENQQLGYEYAENFSKIYRYLLINATRDVISLEEEIKFLKSYMFLIEHRLGDGVQFQLDVDADYKRYQMPPLTIQLLVENALKHNRTSKKEPLVVRIYTNREAELVVENGLLPIEKSDSSGMGLKNIMRRYSLLSNKLPRITRNEVTFQVVLPLLK